MDAISYTAARANLAQTTKRVCADHEPMIITRNGEPFVVMLSLDNFKALEETAYLLRSPRNARRLMDAVDSLEAGSGQDHVLAECNWSSRNKPEGSTSIGKPPIESCSNASMP
jgi:antitoxin YefM